MHGDLKSEGGLASPLRSLVLAALSYLRARLELAGMEGKEAVTQLGAMMLLAALAFTCTIAGYLLLCLALVFGVSKLFSSEHAWIWIAAAAGLLQLVVAWGILRLAMSCLQKPMFAATLEEFRKDDAWLRSTAARQR